MGGDGFLALLERLFQDAVVAPLGRVIFFDVAFWSDDVDVPLVVLWLIIGAVYSTLRFRFVNLTLWESAEHIAAVHDERFHELVSRPELDGFTAHPGIYEIISEG